MDGDVVKNLAKRHEDSEEMLPVWQRAKDCRKGQTAIHKAGVKYLPKLSGQTTEEYDAYKRRAVFYGAMSRTVDAFGGMIMRTEPTIDNPQTLLDDVTNTGVSLYDFTAELLDQQLTVGVVGILVEHTPDVKAVTRGQAQQMGARPYLASFDAKCLLNWRMAKGKFVMVVLEEDEYVSKSEFEQVEREVYRVLDIDKEGFYRQRKFVQSEKNKEEFIQDGDDIYPTMNGAKLKEIPFYVAGEIESLPPLIDIVDLNISHYMTTADLENGRHFTGLPTPVVSGVQLAEGEKLTIGSSSAWVFPQPDARASYLEFTGQGLGSLEKGLETKEKQMAALGARMLSDTVVAETATAASLKSSGEFSVLAMTARKLSNVLSKACSFMYQWAGLGDVTITLNTDFLPARMTPEELNSLVLAWQSGAISYQTLHANMQQGEIVSPSSTPEDEQAGIIEAAPVMSVPEVQTVAPVEQVPLDLTPIVAAIANMQPPTINVAAPDMSGIAAAIAAMPAPVVNVPAPVINMPATNITMPEQVINVTTPDVTVNQPDITVNSPDVVVNNITPQDKGLTITRDADGNITGATRA